MNPKIIFLILISFIIIPTTTRSQNCNCESNFEWLKKTFEENDAGFHYIIDKKGQVAYDIHNQLILEKIKSAGNLTECTKLLYEWLTFFRSGHIGIEPLIQDSPKTKEDYETVAVDIPAFEKYINSKKKADFEGIWETSPYKIGIKKEGNEYVGFIIESGAETWKQGQVKLKITQNGNKLTSVYYMGDHSPREYEAPEMLGSVVI